MDGLTHACFVNGETLCRNSDPQDKYAPFHVRKNAEDYLDRVITCQRCFDRAWNLVMRMRYVQRLRSQ